MLFNRLRADLTTISFFNGNNGNYLRSRDVINILKCKIAEPLSFSFLWLLNILKISPFEDFQLDTNLHFYSTLNFGVFTPQDIKVADRMSRMFVVCLCRAICGLALVHFLLLSRCASNKFDLT